MTAAAAPKETREFKTELKQLLHIITHSLYSHREIFLRELISNAADAINKVRFDSIAHEERLEGDRDWKVRITPDKAARTLTVSDNGVGMSFDEAAEHLGTIAKSGTRAFLESLRQQNASNRPDLIGQFGVGFYSAFMVADRVTVVSRPAGSPADGVRWESEGHGEFTIEHVEKPGRGTDVILHLKEDAKEFLEEWTLRDLVRKFSDFIEFPIVMEVEREDKDKNKTRSDETLNSQKAVWLRSKSEVTPEEYAAFYKSISGDSADPAKVVHYAAEGATEFKVLVFIPPRKPFVFDWEEPKAGLRLYVQRVLIMDRCEALLPPYLRFVKGVVDSSDLPLNISRELLQQNPLLEKISKNVVKNVLDALAAMKNNEYDKYVTFYRDLGGLLKEGVGRDWNNREKLADLLLFESMKTPAGQYTTLSAYVGSMPEGQAEIYYLIGESRELIERSPLLEAYRAKGYDVLLLTDPVDEFAIPSLGKYKDKSLVAVDRAETAPQGDEPSAEVKQQFAGLLADLKGKLTEVSDVRLSKRLTESASCLVTGSGAMTAHMEQLLKKLGRLEEADAGKRVLELNPTHPAVTALLEVHRKDANDGRVEAYGRLLYDQAVIAEGSKVKDPSALARRINELLARDARA